MKNTTEQFGIILRKIIHELKDENKNIKDLDIEINDMNAISFDNAENQIDFRIDVKKFKLKIGYFEP